MYWWEQVFHIIMTNQSFNLYCLRLEVREKVDGIGQGTCPLVPYHNSFTHFDCSDIDWVKSLHIS